MLRRREATSAYSRKDAQKSAHCRHLYSCLTEPLRQVWINQGDIILLSLREFQDGKADVIVKYTADEARNCKWMQFYFLGTSKVGADPTQVKAYGELPENAKINETDAFGEEEGECTFEFGDDGEVDIDDI